jgi:hypothetical protein
MIHINVGYYNNCDRRTQQFSISNGIIEFLHMIVALVSSSRLNVVRRGLVMHPRVFPSLDDVEDQIRIKISSFDQSLLIQT